MGERKGGKRKGIRDVGREGRAKGSRSGKQEREG